MYIKCHSHSHAPSITPNSKRLRLPARPPARPAGRPDEGVPHLAAFSFPRPLVFQNRRTFLPQKARRYTTANHFIISNTLQLLRISQRRVLLWQPSPASNAGRLGDVGLGLSSDKISRRCLEICSVAVCWLRAHKIYTFFPQQGQLRLMFSAFKKSD